MAPENISSRGTELGACHHIVDGEVGPISGHSTNRTRVETQRDSLRPNQSQQDWSKLVETGRARARTELMESRRKLLICSAMSAYS